MRIKINCADNHNNRNYYSSIKDRIINLQNYSDKVTIEVICSSPLDLFGCESIFEMASLLSVVSELYVKFTDSYSPTRESWKALYTCVCSFFAADECTPYYSIREKALLLKFKCDKDAEESTENSNRQITEIVEGFPAEIEQFFGNLTYLGVGETENPRHLFCVGLDTPEGGGDERVPFQRLQQNPAFRQRLEHYLNQTHNCDLCIPWYYSSFDIHMGSTARSEWRRVYCRMVKLQSHVKNIGNYFFDLYVTVSRERVEGESVDDLRYYFPLENAFHEHIIMHINYQQNDKAQASRILQLFGSAPANLLKTVFLNQQQLNEVSVNTSLLWLRQQIRDKDISPGLDFDSFFSVLNKNADSLWKRLFKETDSPAEQSEKTMSKLSSFSSNMSPLMTTVMADGTIDYPKNNILNHTLLANLKNSGNYVGNSEKTDDSKKKEKSNSSFSSEKKQAISDELCKLVEEKAQNISTLAYTILLFILRNLVKQKEIFSDNINELTSNFIREDIFDKVLVDAQSYANGLYQLIENSCQHSHGKKAFWGMRIYKADRNAPPGEFEKQSRTLVHLINRYGNNYMQKKNNAYFIEFFVLDEATDFEGIVTKYNQHFLNSIGNKGVNSIDEIIEMDESKYRDLISENSAKGASINTTIDDQIDLFYTQHYGLRWFAEITSRNNGAFYIYSPNRAETSHYTSYELDEKKKEDQTHVPYFTEYSILLPLTYTWSEIASSNETLPQIKTIDSQSIFREITFVEKQWPSYDQATTKRDKIDNAHKALTQNVDLSQDIYWYMDIESISYEEIEIVAKVLFKLIYHQYAIAVNKQQKSPSSPKASDIHKPNVRIAICVGEKKLYIPEFVRIFSIFYGKMGENPYMKNVQIALCSQPQAGDNSKEVNFVIAGTYLSSAFATANSFLYYGSESTVEYLHLLKYLTVSKETKKAKGTRDTTDICSIFPFDLYLHSTNAESWFLERMKFVISKELYMEDYGCKIEDTVIKLSSGVCLNSFYAAELLFHNIANVYRFAYLLAKDILQDLEDLSQSPSPDSILLVGYESYSSVLLQTIKEMLAPCNKRIGTAIVIQNDYRTSHVDFLTPLDSLNNGILCYTVVPITTTMTTIHKLHGKIRDEISDVCFRKNFSIIAVNELLEDRNLIMEEGNICSKYWKNYSIDKKTVTLLPAKFNPENPVNSECTVQYFLSAHAKWLDSESVFDDIGVKTPPIIQVDKTSLLPKSIFDLQENNRKEFLPRGISANKYNGSEKTKNDTSGKVSSLEPKFNGPKCTSYVWYSHVFKGENHFQFCFNFPQYARDHKEGIEKWAQSQAVDRFAYNIIVSPSNITNSLFLKIVIDNCFSSSLRFLHIDINNIYKDDARSKFSYIAKEMRNLYGYNPQLTFNFYYVDDSIVTGQTLNRGRMLMQMIIQQAGIDEKNVNLFKKIFLLVNRSSYETINTYVKDPKTDFCYYLSLVPPSYNTQNDLCPGCLVQQRYALLRKRSATIAISGEFARLESKHEKKNAHNYVEWLEQQILHDPSYFAWYTLWLYHENMKGKREEYTSITNRIAEFVKENTVALGDETDRDPYLRKLSTLTLDDFFKWDLTSDTNITFELERAKFVVAQRAYLRLRTMDDAYRKLYENCLNLKSIENSTEQATVTIWEILASACTEGTFYDKYEAIMSYIKVISREHLVNYYHIRSAIISVLLSLLAMFKDSSRLPPLDEHQEVVYNTLRSSKNDASEKPCAALQCQLYITICHRLALLQCSQGYSTEYIVNMIDCYEHLKEKFFGEDNAGENPNYHSLELTRIPCERKVIEKYCGTIKTATMLTNDDAGCFRLLNLIDELPCEDDLPHEDIGQSKSAIMSGIRQTLLLENTRIVFDFMEALSNDSEKEAKELIYSGLGGLKERKRIKEEEEKFLESQLKQVYMLSDSPEREEIILRQNPLGRYVRYWCNYFRVPKSIEEHIPRLAKLFHYFRLVRHLSELQQEQMNEHYDALPYLYEDICLTLAENTNHKMCYIVTKDEDDQNFSIVARSGYIYSDGELCGEINQLSSNACHQYQKLFNDIECRERDGNFDSDSSNKSMQINCLQKWINNIYSFRLTVDGNQHHAGIVLSFPFSLVKTNHGSDNRNFFILLLNTAQEDLNEKPLTDEFVKEIGLILFLRDRLMQILRRDYSSLLNYRYDCGYIKSLKSKRGDEKADETVDETVVLHISDLHVKDDLSWNKNSKKRKEIRDRISEEIQGDPPDLIAVTGDIVAASNDGLTAQIRYRNAGEFLLEIVSKLWGIQGDAFVRLPHDWKRRLIITTGNHDYLTMNETASVTESRQTTYAKPIEQSGTTMMKFTYFIDFLQSFLDAPIDRLIANDLNEMRLYKNLQMNILVLNTVSAANALQNNKVGVSKEHIEYLIAMPKWKASSASHLCLCHHRPDYPINYSKDIYSDWKIRKEAIPHKAIKLLDTVIEVMQKKTEESPQDTSADICCVYEEFLRHVKEIIELFWKEAINQGENNSCIKEWEKSEEYETLKEMVNNVEYGHETFESITKTFFNKPQMLRDNVVKLLQKVIFDQAMDDLITEFHKFLTCVFLDQDESRERSSEFQQSSLAFQKTYHAFTQIMEKEECTSISKSLMFKEMERIYKDLSSNSSRNNPISLNEFQVLMKKDEFNIEFFSKLYTRWIMSASDKKEFREIINNINHSVADSNREKNGVFYLAGHEHKFITGTEKGNTNGEKSRVVNELRNGFAIAIFTQTKENGSLSTKITYTTHNINKK